MPKITGVTASRSCKINLGNFESRDAFISVSVEPEPGEDYDTVLCYAEALAQREIKKIERIIRNGDDDMKVSDIMNRKPALPVIGTIRKGGERGTSKKGNFKGGDDLDYFRVEFKDADAARVFEQVYGKEPTRIKVMLAYTEIERAWRITFEAYNASGNLQLATDGDEEGCTVLFCAADPARVGTPYRPGVDLEVKARARLSVIVPALQRVAALNFVTNSTYDIMRITDALKYYFSDREDGGLGLPANNIPLILYRSPEEVATSYTNRDGQLVRSRSIFSLVKLEIDPDWAQLQLLARQQDAYALVGGHAAVPELGPGDLDDYGVDIETGEIIEDEPAKPTHWTQNSEYVERFWAMVEDSGMTDRQALDALSVEALEHYEGSAKDAKSLIDSYRSHITDDDLDVPPQMFDALPSNAAKGAIAR